MEVPWWTRWEHKWLWLFHVCLKPDDCWWTRKAEYKCQNISAMLFTWFPAVASFYGWWGLLHWMVGVGGWIRFPKRRSDETKTVGPPCPSHQHRPQNSGFCDCDRQKVLHALRSGSEFVWGPLLTSEDLFPFPKQWCLRIDSDVLIFKAGSSESNKI